MRPVASSTTPVLAKSLLRGFVVLGGIGVVVPAQAAWQMNLTPGVTDMAHHVWALHMAMLGLCCTIFFGVCLVMAWSIVRHRRARGVVPATFDESIGVEIAWTVIPFVVLAIVAIPAASLLVASARTGGADVRIDITGHQWLWEYRYPDAGVHFYSRLAADSRRAELGVDGARPSQVAHYLRDVDHPMVVPVHARVRLNITSGDVIHSWWVPALGGKMDAIPGRINHKYFQADAIGVYRGQCAALCGRGHAFMPIVVKVVSKADYIAWITAHGGKAPAASALPDASASQVSGPDYAALAASHRLTRKEAMTLGRHVYLARCAACHQPDGAGMPAAGYPALAAGATATGPIDGAIDQVIHGHGAMPAFGNRLSDAEIAAVVTYVRNAFGNRVGDQARAAAVAARR